MESSRKKILVLGGAGYIGGLVVDQLQQAGFDPYVYDSLLYEERYLKPVTFINGDVRDTKKIYDLHRQHKFDCFVVLAALVGDPACNVNQKLTEEINYESVKNLCLEMPSDVADVHFIFASTCSVYGANDKLMSETSPAKPLSSYASTKLRAEKHMLDKGATVFRLGTVYGVGDHYSRIRADLVVNTLTIKAFTEGEITVNGGAQYRPIISVTDIAGYMTEACKRKDEVKGLYNLGYRNVQIFELADDILAIMPNTKVNKIDQMFQDERNYKVNTDLVNSKFTYKPHITVEEEVKKLYNLLKDGRIKDPHSINYNNGLFLAQRRI